MPPPVPLTVMTWAPSGAFLGILTVITDAPEPGAGMGFGLKVAMAPPDKVTAESKPPSTFTVILENPEAPLFTLIALGEALMEKLPVSAGPASALIRLSPFGLPQPVAKS